MGSDPVRVAIAGLGRAGWGLHAKTLAEMPRLFRVVAVCDPLEERRQEAETRFGCRAYPSFDGILGDEEAELVVVAMPSHLHADLAVAALEAGKDVLVEKPFTTSVAEADRMIEAARRTGRLLMGSQNLRYEGEFLKVKEVIDSGKLGRILEIRVCWHWFRRRWDWQTLSDFGGGTLNNDGSHVIDQALLLLGEAEPRVTCRMMRTPLSAGSAEDYVKILMTAPGAPVVDIELTNACAFPQPRWLVLGTQGTLCGGPAQLRWKYVNPHHLPEHRVASDPTPDRSYNREDLPFVSESSDLSSEAHTAMHLALYSDLYETLRHHAPAAISLASIRRQLAVIEACRAAGPVEDLGVGPN